jgi:hypothetical protein
MMSKAFHKVLVFACFICLSFLLFEDRALAANPTLTITFNPVTISINVAYTSSTEGEQTIYTLSTGEKVSTYVDAEGAVVVHSYDSAISVVAGATTTIVGPDETIRALVNPDNGSASVKAVKGTVEVKVGEATAVLKEGASIECDVDAAGVATIEATAGNVSVTAAGVTRTLTPGKKTTVTPGNPPTMPVSAAPTAVPPPPPPPFLPPPPSPST